MNETGEAINGKQPEFTNRKAIVFHYDNVRLHTSLLTHKQLLELGQEVMFQPHYCSGLAPSDYR